ncbi:MAG: hypothetical protein WC873_01720 [Candidatus Gracilibacteria bacterium]
MNEAAHEGDDVVDEMAEKVQRIIAGYGIQSQPIFSIQELFDRNWAFAVQGGHLKVFASGVSNMPVAIFGGDGKLQSCVAGYLVFVKSLEQFNQILNLLGLEVA